jgi:hypothetical protein
MKQINISIISYSYSFFGCYFQVTRRTKIHSSSSNLKSHLIALFIVFIWDNSYVLVWKRKQMNGFFLLDPYQLL